MTALLENRGGRGSNFILWALRSFLARIMPAMLRWLSLLLLLAGAVLAVHGNAIVLAGDSESERLAGLPYMGLGVVVWLAGELLRDLPRIYRWWRGLGRAGKALMLGRILPLGMILRASLLVIESMWVDSALPLLLSALVWLAAAAFVSLALALYGRRIRRKNALLQAGAGALIVERAQLPGRSLPRGWQLFLALRACLLAVAVGLSATVWQQTSDNRFHGNALWLWLLSSVAWCLVFAPRGWSPLEWLTRQTDHWRRIQWWRNFPILLCVAGILALGAMFRFARLEDLPREMLNNDHVLEIEYALRIADGQRPIMVHTFQYQEALLAYMAVILDELTGVGLGHLTLQLVTSLTSLAMTLLMLWVGAAWAWPTARPSRLATGLLCAGLVAVSFWDVVVTRYALRPSFTPVFAALTMIFLARAMRGNRRGDFLLLGLTLGFGMYGYTAYRIWAGAAVLGLVVTLALRRLNWRQRLDYVVNAAIAGIVACAIYLPQYHYFSDNPFLAASQISHNMLGIVPGETLETGIDQFLTGLMLNLRDAMLMFHWGGDHRAWQNVPYKPALNAVEGAFFLLGLAALIVRLVRRPRQPVYWLHPALVLIGMLPSVLLVAQPQTNPSNTRISGAIPAVYLLAAMPPAIIASRLVEGLRRPLGAIVGAALCVGIVLASAGLNAEAYFINFAWVERLPGNSFRHIGRTMRGYAQSGGSWGNVFFVESLPFIPSMQNGFVEAGQPALMRSGSGLEGTVHLLDSASRREDEYRIDPDVDIIFLYVASSDEIGDQLRQWFPQGNGVVMSDRAYFGRDYVVYRVPALGEAGLQDFLARHL